MKKKNKKCLVCGKKLTGSQKKFCGYACSNKGRKFGRKPMLTEKMKHDIRKKIEIGLNYKDVCKAVGIVESTFFRWKSENEEFCKLVEQANIKVKEISLASVRRGELNDWRAGAWRLERRFPEEYKEQKIIETNQPILIDDIMNEKTNGEKRKSKN